MSREVAKQIIERSKCDNQFLESLLQDPDTTLQEYELTTQERDFFRQADRKTLEGLSASCFELGPQP